MKRPSAWPALPAALGPETGPQALDWWSLWSSGHLEERSGRKRGRQQGEEEETERKRGSREEEEKRRDDQRKTGQERPKKEEIRVGIRNRKPISLM